MVSEEFIAQRQILGEGVDHWLELYEKELSWREVEPSERPLKALTMLLEDGGVGISYGDDRIDTSKPFDHFRTEWFRILFDAIRHWYIEKFGVEAMRPKSSRPLEGVVMFRGAPFRLAVPATRFVIEEAGKSASIYFEDGLGAAEDPLAWIKAGPDISKLDGATRAALAMEAEDVASTLRFVEFRRSPSSEVDDQEARNLVASASTYLQQAAKRIVTAADRERGPAWFDLQMAVEAALKAVIRHFEGDQPRIHELDKLLQPARKYGVMLEESVVSDWPNFRELSEWRYGQGTPWSTKWLHAAYRTALKIARESMSQMPIALKPGFSVQIECPPWLRPFE